MRLEKIAMGKIWDATGKAVVFKGVFYIIENVRSVYGTGLQLTLNKPLAGNTSCLFTVNEEDAIEVAARLKDIK